MNRDEHRAMRELLGVFLLDGLSDREAAAVQAHLDGCPECGEELADIAPAARALRGIDPQRLDDTPVPPPWLGDQIMDRISREQASTRSITTRRPLAMAAAAAAIAGIAGGGLGFVAGSGPAVPREPVVVYAMAAGIDASATVVPHTWGTEITLVADGFSAGAVYRAVVLDDAGNEADAGQFVGTGVESMRCNLNSSVLRAQAAGFEVLDADGTVVLRGDL